ncbi:MAG: flagellar biosynthesis anti-sigma factor FlgM [Pseudomonadota bacterium]
MTDAINTHNRLRTNGITSDSRASSAAKSDQQADSRPAGGAGEASVVDLSNSTLIQELQDQIKNLPEVNQARVDAIKEALGNGEYEADAEVIARKYSEIEKLLP